LNFKLLLVLLCSAPLLAQSSLAEYAAPDAARDTWQRPAEIVAALKLTPGMRVADVGAGTGYLIPHLRRAVGPKGSVIAVEPHTYRAKILAGRFPGLHITSSLTWTMDLDAAVLLQTFGVMDDRDKTMALLHGSLKRGGRVVVCDNDEPAMVIASALRRYGFRVTKTTPTFIGGASIERLPFALVEAVK
jgi:ubiquinone/menaquinone biosynthesis C-methylase UbiE